MCQWFVKELLPWEICKKVKEKEGMKSCNYRQISNFSLVHGEPWHVSCTSEFVSTWGKNLGPRLLYSDISHWLIDAPETHMCAWASSSSNQGQPHKESHKWGSFRANASGGRDVTKMVKGFPGDLVEHFHFPILVSPSLVSTTGLTFQRITTMEI